MALTIKILLTTFLGIGVIGSIAKANRTGKSSDDSSAVGTFIFNGLLIAGIWIWL